MSVETIVCSKNRACQLDLLLRSLDENAPGFADPLHVVWTASDEEYERGYLICAADHPEAVFQREPRRPDEFGFQRAIRQLLKQAGPLVMFAMDDDVLYRELDVEPTPEELMADARVACVSLRLGQNTSSCYPMNGALQGLPIFTEVGPDALTWEWRTAELDLGYVVSLDLTVFRTAMIVALQHASEYRNPSQLEDVLIGRSPGMIFEPLMAAYRRSCAVGIPANVVTTTHFNRYAERNFRDTHELNDRFVLGERLSLGHFMRTQSDKVMAAHADLPLVFR